MLIKNFQLGQLETNCYIVTDEATLQSHIIDASPKDVRRYIAEYIQLIGTITPRLRGDWEVVPAAWWQKGMATDKRFTNPNQR